MEHVSSGQSAAYTNGLSEQTPAHPVLRHTTDSLRTALLLVIALGALLVCVNLRWPIARNALDYAKAALGIASHHYDLYALAHDEGWTGGKPILFSVIAAPFVWLTTASTGIIIASALGSAFFLCAVALALPRLNLRSGVPQKWLPLEFVLTVFNPLVLYQFWSGYPDSMLAGLAMLALILVDIIAYEPERDTRWHIVGLGVTIITAIHLKLYGGVLLLSCSLYLLNNIGPLIQRSSFRGAKLVLLGGSLCGVATALIAARHGVNPLLVLDSGAGFDDYVTGLAHLSLRDIGDTLAMLVFALVLAFQCALLFLLKPSAWRSWAAAPAMFVGVYALGLLPAAGASYNMRYFIPVFPFLAPAIAAGAGALSPVARRVTLALYIAVAVVTTLNFNVGAIERALAPLTAKLYLRYPALEGWLDNLRLPQQMAIRKQIDTINAEVPNGAVLYWSSDYYGTATHGLAHELGVRRDLIVRYVLEPSDPPVTPAPSFLTEFTAVEPPDELWQAPKWATPRPLRNGLFRLDPIAVSLVSLSGEFVGDAQPIKLRAKTVSTSGLQAGEAHFRDNGIELPADPDNPFDLTISAATPGRHELITTVEYGGGQMASSPPTVVFVGTPALERAANSAGDLIMELRDGEIYAPHDLLILANETIVATRFDAIGVTKGARIADARLLLTAAGSATKATSLEIRATLTPDAAGLTFKKRDLSHRPRTRSAVTWNVGPWSTVADPQRSPNLAQVLEEVFAQAGWRSGNSIMLLIHITGQDRLVRTFDSKGRNGPSLYIRFAQPSDPKPAQSD